MPLRSRNWRPAAQLTLARRAMASFGNSSGRKQQNMVIESIIFHAPGTFPYILRDWQWCMPLVRSDVVSSHVFSGMP